MEKVVFETQLGAEARIELATWRGKPAIRKIRIPKEYRNSDLDTELRTRRTREEAEIIHRLKIVAAVNCPQLFFVDGERQEIIMSYIPGRTLKEAQRKDKSLPSRYYQNLGRAVARMHLSDIIHGDLTSKNLILLPEYECAFLDFGLSFISSRIEDRAEDLHLLRQAFTTSIDLLEESKRAFDLVMKGYESINGRKKTLLVSRQMNEIARRGRYARVD